MQTVGIFGEFCVCRWTNVCYSWIWQNLGIVALMGTWKFESLSGAERVSKIKDRGVDNVEDTWDKFIIILPILRLGAWFWFCFLPVLSPHSTSYQKLWPSLRSFSSMYFLGPTSDDFQSRECVHFDHFNLGQVTSVSILYVTPWTRNLTRIEWKCRAISDEYVIPVAVKRFGSNHLISKRFGSLKS